MGSVAPVSSSDLNGIALSPQDLVTDDLIGYVSYVRNLCTDLGTKNDSPEGWQDYLNFQKEIEDARISTFEPDTVDDQHTFESLDLTGEGLEITDIPRTYFAMLGASILWACAMNNGAGYTPFDLSAKEKKGQYVPFNGEGLTPFSLGIPIKKSEEVALTA